MNLTTYSLNKMGFNKIDPSNPISAQFASLSIFSVIGIQSDENTPLNPVALVTAAGDLKFTIGDDLNAMCRALLNDDFMDELDKWTAERNLKPPFLMVLASDPAVSQASSGAWQAGPNGEIITFDTFAQAKQQLFDFEEHKVSALATSLALKLSTATIPVTIQSQHREVFGWTADGKIVRDIKFVMNANLVVSSTVNDQTIMQKINDAVALHSRLITNVGYFYNQASNETDLLKRFLYLFFSLEAHTKSTFKTLTSIPHANYPNRLMLSLQYIDTQSSGWRKFLTQNFLWCAIECWNTVDDSDFATFRISKDLRDKISHAEKIDEKALPVDVLDKLLRKILLHA